MLGEQMWTVKLLMDILTAVVFLFPLYACSYFLDIKTVKGEYAFREGLQNSKFVLQISAAVALGKTFYSKHLSLTICKTNYKLSSCSVLLIYHF